MVNAINAYSQSVLTQTSTSQLDETDNDKTNTPNRTSGEQTEIIDHVDISAEAQELAKADQAKNAALDAKVAYFEQFRPTREGFSSRNIALGIVDPSAQPFSQHRSFEDVAQAARENMDSKYEQMRESGEPFGTDNFEGKEWYSLMGDLDRRALYAVASNEGGSFSKEEQDIASNIMSGQQGMAMGLYNGPTRLAGEFHAPLPTTNADHMRNYKAGVQFMDQVSIEEQATSVEWAYQRGSMQYSYEHIARSEGQIPDDMRTDNPLVNLVIDALEAQENSPELMFSDADISSKEELLDEPWFKGYEDRLDDAIEQTRTLYSSSE